MQKIKVKKKIDFQLLSQFSYPFSHESKIKVSIRFLTPLFSPDIQLSFDIIYYFIISFNFI